MENKSEKKTFNSKKTASIYIAEAEPSSVQLLMVSHSDQSANALPQYMLIFTSHNFSHEFHGQKDDGGQSIIA